MDTPTLVDGLIEGGIEGLRRAVRVLEANGIDVDGAYLIKLSAEDGSTDIVFRIVTPERTHPFISKIVNLRRRGELPRIDDSVRLSATSPSSPEARRVLDYAERVGGPYVKIRGTGLDGLYVEEALVVKWPTRQRARV